MPSASHMVHNFKDLTGHRFSRLLVLHRDLTSKVLKWVVQCDCGNVRSVRSSKLNSGEHKSCGCLRAEVTKQRHLDCRVLITADGKRRCSYCKQPKLTDEFSKSVKTLSGFQTRCKDCALATAWRKAYGLTREEALRLVQERKAASCAVCDTSDDIHLDHDHETNALRGFLCGNCNRALGLLRDDPARIQELLNYITKYLT